MHATAGGKAGLHATVQNSDPGERQAQCLWSAQENIRADLQFVEIDVRLIEAIEQHKSIGASLIKTLRHVRQIAEERTDLHGYGDRYRTLHRFYDVQISLLYVGGGTICVGRDGIDVALDSVRSGLLDFLGILRPSACSRAVQAGDDGNVHSLFGLADVLQVSLGPETILARLRKVGQGFSETLRAGTQVMIELEGFLAQLFFEQGIQDDGGGPSVFEP